ncbi:MAG: Do family serine endopeptidase [Chlamydiales bacterium]|nr:Do family serine endopeptidase [Chlamydiales bacterium]
MKAPIKYLFLSVLFISTQLHGSIFQTKEETKATESKAIAYDPSSDNQCSQAKEFSKAFTSVAKKSIPAVVFIKVESSGDLSDYLNQSPEYQDPFDLFQDDFFNRFFGPAPKKNRKAPVRRSQGSGFFVTSDGYIMTNFHVVKDATKITVDLNPPLEKQLDATLVGGDPQTDIAILKVDGSNYPFLQFGSSDEMDVGEWVVAVGNPFQLQASVTVGVVSAKGRNDLQITDLEDFIQTDAAINPGNSGGPLLNLDAQVIGMNTAILSPSGGYMGIGFAIPSSILKNVQQQIISNGEVSRGSIGVMLQPIDQDLAEALKLEKPEGALVAQVKKDSPADKAGLKQGDIIIKLNDIPVKSMNTLRNDIMLMPPNTTIQLTINRQGKMMVIPVKIEGNDAQSNESSIAIKKLGIEVETLTPEVAKRNGYTEESGVIITKVMSGSIAQSAGIRTGWVILAVNHKKVSNADEFNKALEGMEGNRVLILMNVKGSMRFFSLKLPK